MIGAGNNINLMLGSKISRYIVVIALLILAVLWVFTSSITDDSQAGFREREAGYRTVAAVSSVIVLLVFSLLLFMTVKQDRISAARRESEELFARAFINAPIGMALVSPDGRWIRVNEQLCRILGYWELELLALTVQEVTHPDDVDVNAYLRRQMLAGEIENYSVEKRYCHKSGKAILCQLTASLVRDSQGKPVYFVSQIEDITERRQAEDALRLANDFLERKVDERTSELMAMNGELEALNEELQRLTLADGLTGIANRRYFDEYIEKEWRTELRQQKPLSLIMADIDFFKSYNDTYGHQSGDDCLTTVARTISNSIRRSTDMAARYGGEEFAVVLPYTDLDGAMQVAETIRKQVEDLRIENRQTEGGYVTISLGVFSMIPSAQESPVSLISMADKALYQAKHAGRNRVMTGSRDMIQPA